MWRTDLFNRGQGAGLVAIRTLLALDRWLHLRLHLKALQGRKLFSFVIGIKLSLAQSILLCFRLPLLHFYSANRLDVFAAAILGAYARLLNFTGAAGDDKELVTYLHVIVSFEECRSASLGYYLLEDLIFHFPAVSILRQIVTRFAVVY